MIPMHRSTDVHQLSMLLRTSRELDIVGDVTATVDGPTDLLAWASLLPEPAICAWRSHSGHRYVQATARHDRLPVHGIITAVLNADQNPHFWNELVDNNEPAPGDERMLTPHDLTRTCAWEATPPDTPDLTP
jgi:hypothetical protein